MKPTMITKGFRLTVGACLLTTIMWAQDDKSSRPSPPATATGIVDGSTVTINYSSPAVKGRQIWGALVPYDTVWRAGANEATLFETSKDIVVEGKPLAAGKYSLFAIPRPNEWTIIFNAEVGQWGDVTGGAANCDPKKNVLSVNVKPIKSAGLAERLKYDVNNKGFVLRWENVEVPVAIK